MRGHVDRKAGDGLGEVEAVIEIESAKVVLVGFALAAVLADDEAGYRLEHFGRAVDGRTASCAAVMAPSLAADATPTRFSAGFSISARLRNVRGAVTTISALVATSMTALACTAAPDVTLTVRRTMLKLISRMVSSADPAGTLSNRYEPTHR